jgi:small nuclear ribonucleoprotein (snRNP)-like protein
MDSPLHHYANRELAAELRQLRDRNVLLLLIDGSAVFGRLGRLDDNIVTVLPAVSIVGVTTVRFRPPNPTLPGVDILVSQFLVDVCDIAIIVEGPFVFPPISETGKAVSGGKYGGLHTKSGKAMVRQQCELIDELADFEGQSVGVVVVGGWVVGGQLGEVSECVAVFGPGTTSSPLLITLGAINVFGPALVGGVQPMVGTFRTWVNLRALTGLLIP